MTKFELISLVLSGIAGVVAIVSLFKSWGAKKIALEANVLAHKANEIAGEANHINKVQTEKTTASQKENQKNQIIENATEQWAKMGQPYSTLVNKWKRYKDKGFSRSDFEEIWIAVHTSHKNKEPEKPLFETLKEKVQGFEE